MCAYTHIHKGRFIISFMSLIGSVSLENPDTAPKLPFCVWSILHPMSPEKYITHHLRNAKDHKCHQLPMQLQFRCVTQAWPARCTIPDIASDDLHEAVDLLWARRAEVWDAQSVQGEAGAAVAVRGPALRQ